MIIWITGQPGQGKTSLGQELAAKLKCANIDGKSIWQMFGIDNATFLNRVTNVANAQDLARMISQNGKDVVVSMVSPYRNQREEFKKEQGDNLLEVYVHAKDDPNRPRKSDWFEGYEPPIENFLSLDTSAKSVAQCVIEVLRRMDRA